MNIATKRSVYRKQMELLYFHGLCMVLLKQPKGQFVTKLDCFLVCVVMKTGEKRGRPLTLIVFEFIATLICQIDRRRRKID